MQLQQIGQSSVVTTVVTALRRLAWKLTSGGMRVMSSDHQAGTLRPVVPRFRCKF
jgi:hypothetical protein